MFALKLRVVSSLAVLAAIASAQSAVTWEAAFDDHGPPDSMGDLAALIEPDGHPSDWGVEGWPLTIDYPSALAVKVADFDQDGTMDIVVGGNVDQLPQVHYLSKGHVWNIKYTETLGPAHFSWATYDLDVGDINEDGYPDIVLGRKVEQCIPEPPERCTPDLKLRTDTVFFNRGARPDLSAHFDNPGGGSAPMPGGSNPPLSLPIPLTSQEPPGWRETIGIKLRHFESPGALGSPPPPIGIVTSGRYGLRYFQFDPNTQEFTHVQSIFESATPALQNVYRQFAAGDIDNDGDIDIVVPRGTKAIGDPNAVPEVYTFDGVAGAFSSSPTQSLFAPDAYRSTIRQVGGTCPAPVDYISLNEPFEAALGDLNGDGYLDLAIANSKAPNAIYMNDKTGKFGSGHSLADGHPALELTSVTPDFVGPPVVNPYAPEPGCLLEITYAGGYLDHSTGVTMFDDDGDGTIDLVAFSNRNDPEEDFTIKELMCEYITADPVAFPVPAVYDHVYRNLTANNDDVITFSPYVELLGEPNDGTAYGEFFNLNSNEDHSPEWIDANFSNVIQCHRNFLYWGHTLTARSERGGEFLPHIQDHALDEEFIEYPLHVAITESIFVLLDTATVDFEVFVSSTGSYPGEWEPGDAVLPLMTSNNDRLDTLCKASGSTASGFTGAIGIATPPTTGKPIALEIDVVIPRAFLSGIDEIWFAVVLRDATPSSSTWVSNALHAPNTFLGTPTSPPNPQTECVGCP